LVDVTAAPYRAAGDGLTNDRPAIQQAIDDVSNRGGGTVVLPAGKTFLSGNLFMKNKVALQIDGTLEQSQNPHHYTYEPLRGHRDANAPYAYAANWYINYPLVYAGHKNHVRVTGHGTIQMTQESKSDGSFDEDATIHVLPVGFFEVDHFEISELSILGASTFNGVAYWSTNGLVQGLNIHANPAEQTNTDGFHFKDSQHMRLLDNTFDVHDDGIVVGSMYDDPRDGTWWQSKQPMPTSDIEIAGNTVLTPRQGGVVFIPWATNAPDASSVEISDIRIHDNTFVTGRDPVAVRTTNPFDPSPAGPDDVSPMRDIRIWDNDYTYSGEKSPDARVVQSLRHAPITDLQDPWELASSRDFQNGDFEHLGMAYWSHSGDAGSADNDVSVLRTRTARQAANSLSAQWGHFGYVQGPGGSSLFEGLGVSDAIPYTFRASVTTSGEPAQLFALNTCTGKTVAVKEISNTRAETAELSFRGQGTCTSYHIGIRREGDTGWALIDQAVLTPAVGVLNEDAATLSGRWSVPDDPTSIGHAYAQSTQRGAEASFTFHGTRAWLFSHSRPDSGLAKIYVDGSYKATVDLYHAQWIDGVVYDTGDLSTGAHTLKMVGTGTHGPDSAGNRTSVDALFVENYRAAPADIRLQQGATFQSGTATAVTARLEPTNPDAALDGVNFDLKLPADWTVEPTAHDQDSATWRVTPPADANPDLVQAVALVATADYEWDSQRWVARSDADGYLFPADQRRPDAVIDNDDAGVAFSGSTKVYALAEDVGGSHTSLSEGGAAATIHFDGTRAEFIGAPSAYNGRAEFYVDGQDMGTVDFYREDRQVQQVMFDTGPLASGAHTLRVVDTGETNPDARDDTITFDAAFVWH
jgi:hypothetical protein